MASLALSTDFLAEFHKLQVRQRSRVRELADMFRRLSAAELRAQKGIHLEPHVGAADKRARTIRIDDNHRGIVLDAGDDETFILVRIGTHDETDRWMARNTFRVNEATGALEIVDVAAIEATLGEIAPTPGPTGLFDHRSDKDFTKLGIDPGYIPALRAFTQQDQLAGLLDVFPQGQAEALIMLTGDDSVEELYRQLAGNLEPAQVDVEDLAAAVRAPASRHEYRVFTDQDDLAAMLAQPLKTWRVYLHHTQEALAYRPSFSGPVKVSGGAGTGKTVVALHRTRHLAERAPAAAAPSILLTTYTRNLATALQRDLTALCARDDLDKVEVLNIDRLAHRIVLDAEGAAPRVVEDEHVLELWQQVADELGIDRSPEFLRAEFEQVVLAQDCQSRADYFAAVRSGRGIPLDRRARAELWRAFEAFTAHLAARGERTWLQLAAAAAGYAKARTVAPYQHVVVDEAQDLHETQWRLIRAVVPAQANDLFIVGDSHQRIYDRRSSLRKVGIDVVGRSYRLRINYRTTYEILRWAMALLGETTYDDLDDGVEEQNLAGYHCFLHGDPPTTFGAPSSSVQLEALVTQVKDWLEGGIEPEDIAVAGRTRQQTTAVIAALIEAGLPVSELGQGQPAMDSIRVSTMHRMKGLEFRCVALSHVDDRTVPFPPELTDRDADPAQYSYDLKRELCLLYVACTRAREFLWVGWHGTPSRFLGPLLGG
jgi:superfamily I DNA/RNA helicase